MKDFLPRLLVTLMRHPRHRIVAGKNFKWSDNSWTHNFFRSYETIFGRRSGIRVESASWQGKGYRGYAVYTFEAVCAYTETYLRSFFAGEKFAFRLVPAPVFQTTSGMPFQNPIFSFAIAFDAKSSQGTATSTTNTFNHTCTGSDLVLTSIATLNGQDPTDLNLSGITYATVAMTKGVTSSGATVSASVTIWTLANPSTGANSTVQTSTSAVYGITGYNASFSGANTASPVGATSTGEITTDTSTPSYSLTTSFANSFIVDGTIANGAAAIMTATGTNQTLNASLVTNRRTAASYQSTTTAGSKTQSYSGADAAKWQWANLEVRELVVVAAVGSFPSLLTLGVG